MCRVARDESGVLAGAIRVWPIAVGDAPALLIGPIAVHPTHQGEGLGGALIRDCIAQSQGWDRALLFGEMPRTMAALGFVY